MRETGVGLYEPLFFIGVVENNVDERLEKRVQVRAFGVHGTVDQVPTESLPWATLVYGSYDPNSPLPPINSFVFGFFVDGRDAQQPMILGLIPTQFTEVIDPSITGWGAVPGKDSTILAKGSTPDDYGQPANSRLERGEDIDQTYVLLQEMNRIKDIPSAKSNSDDTSPAFEEPAPAYNAQYPFNRVIETASHSIELDDTPGAERITIFHRSGSYVSIDSNGTSVHKAVSDKYEINDTHQHVYVGGKSNVTIMGDSRVLVKGNKVEEVEGDLVQIVHGNHLLSVAGQMNLNGSEEVQMRAAKLRFEANVENINLKSGRAINIESGQSINVKSGDALFLQSSGATNVKAGEDVFIEAAGTGHIKASTVNIDDNVSMANGDADGAAEAQPAEGAELPEPAAKSASTTGYKNSASYGSSGYASQDEGGGGSSSGSSGADPVAEFSSPANASMDLLQLIKSFEGFSQYPYDDFGQWSIGYGTGVGPSSQPPKIPGPISEGEATRLLGESVQKFVVNVETINQKGNYNWSQESKDALASFGYNIGSINELTANGTRNNATIANKMLEYVNAGGSKSAGLISRRRIEREKFLNGLAGSSGGPV
jgi:GH24 family phage-related lysozyme (muramidase)